MKSFYALTRQIHLFCGLILALAILFYTVSGVTFVYAKWIPREPTRDSTQTTPIPAEFNASVATLREYVASEVSARGRTDGFNALPTGGFRQRWNSPSMRVDAEVSADHTLLTITRSKFGPLRTLRSFHTLSGARGGIGYLGWWLLLDVVSVAMLVFAVTGFLLWYRSTKDKLLGWLLFGGSWAYTIGLIAYLAWF